MLPSLARLRLAPRAAAAPTDVVLNPSGGGLYLPPELEAAILKQLDGEPADVCREVARWLSITGAGVGDREKIPERLQSFAQSWAGTRSRPRGCRRVVGTVVQEGVLLRHKARPKAAHKSDDVYAWWYGFVNRGQQSFYGHIVSHTNYGPNDRL